MKDWYWDLDGVLRNICTPIFGREPANWWSKNKAGRDVLEAIDHDLNILVEAPPSEYYEVVRDLAKTCKIKILSLQPSDWRPYTDQWLNKWLPEAQVLYVSKASHKLDIIGKKGGRLLVEDAPHFSDYSNIILIRRRYNRAVKAARKIIASPAGLELFIEEVRKNGDQARQSTSVSRHNR